MSGYLDNLPCDNKYLPNCPFDGRRCVSVLYKCIIGKFADLTVYLGILSVNLLFEAVLRTHQLHKIAVGRPHHIDYRIAFTGRFVNVIYVGE